MQDEPDGEGGQETGKAEEIDNSHTQQPEAEQESGEEPGVSGTAGTHNPIDDDFQQDQRNKAPSPDRVDEEGGALSANSK